MKITRLIAMIFILFIIVGCEETYPTYTTQEIIESIEIVYAEGDNQESVTKSMDFPLTSPLDDRIKITWESEQPSLIDNFGTVNRPNDDTVVNVSFTVDNFGSKFSQVLSFNLIGKVQITQTTYTINYYFQNLEDNEYALLDTSTIDSEVGKPIVINPTVEYGYQLNTSISILTGTVLDNHALILDIFYDRNIYEIVLLDGASELDRFSVKHGSTINLDNPEKDNYEFVEWRLQGQHNPFDFSTTIESNLTLNAIFKEANDPYTYTGYYQGADGLYGYELEVFLNELLNSTLSGITYGEARYILDDTDQDPNNPGNVILVYAGTSVSGVWDDGSTWNREHVWPQSFLDSSADNSTINSASDLHNLKPANPGFNSSRGNKYFGNSTTPQTYLVRDEVKGDIARILFYMDIMYDKLSLINANEGEIYEMGNLEVLLQWHELDPVDQFEMNRNDIIYSYQGNRNPFIDHPELVDKIYNYRTTQTSLEVTYGIFEHMIFE